MWLLKYTGVLFHYTVKTVKSVQTSASVYYSFLEGQVNSRLIKYIKVLIVYYNFFSYWLPFMPRV